MKYVAAIEGEEYVIGVEDSGELIVNKVPRDVKLERIGDGSLFSLLIGPRSYDTFVERTGDGYLVTVEGERYSVQVGEARTPQATLRQDSGSLRAEAPLSLSLASEGTGSQHAGTGAVTSPMTGVLVEIMAAVGQAVEEGEGVAILEAMKTENVVRAPHRGTVKSIQASTGQALRMDEVIMYLDASEGSE